MPRRRMNEAEIRQKLREAFDTVDVDGDGIITPADLLDVCVAAGLQPTAGDVEALVAVCDADGTGKIGFEEFALAVIEAYVKLKILRKLRIAFMDMDTDGSGFITKENLQELVAAQGEDLSELDAATLIATCDKTGDGNVSFAEFVDAAAAYLEEKLKEAA